MEDYNVNKNFLDKLPNIALIPNHGKMGMLPAYPVCAKREIFCGPYLENKESKERKYIKTNGRFFDINDVILQLDKEDGKFDLVFAPLEVTTACFPKNLSKLECPKIGFIFDTHHLNYSISSIIEYLNREKFTHLLMYAQPAHLHFFYETGITHSAVFPPILQEFNKVWRYYWCWKQ